MTTRPPSRTYRRAVSAPIPLAPPVMMQTLFSKRAIPASSHYVRNECSRIRFLDGRLQV